VGEREIASIVWHDRGHRIEVIYVEGESKNMFGPASVATTLAEEVGLPPVQRAVVTHST
jgi:hypothetical protein